ncbi:unnamed protein product [Urochloa decumbens]|uniref:F-box domain-containing protein n=1 Tax=Urochloa decumbens TaxID=240449 RepID=A0ABC9FWZ0_9POAL
MAIGGGGGADLISSLADDLLHVILLRLRDTAAAARTSVLSRRWRRLWAHLPELSFRYKHQQIYSAQAHERVDAALATHAAGTAIFLLDVGLPSWKPQTTAAAGDPAAHKRLLQFASRRVAGELRLSLRCKHSNDEIVLPPCERTTAIKLSVSSHALRLQPHPGGGAFAALTKLRIKKALANGSDLEDVVSSRCPRLKELFLKRVTLKDGGRALSIRSDSLERLEMADMNVYIFNPHLHLQVIGPELRILSPGILTGSHIVAPKLSELSWRGPYDPVRHYTREAGSHLRRLHVVAMDSPSAMLMRRFNTVHELQLMVKVWKGIENYKEYLENINQLSKCEVLVVGFLLVPHAIKPVMLHLLNKCADVKKLVVRCLACIAKDGCECVSWGCQCGWSKEGHNTYNIALGSLELVEIKDCMTEAHHKVEFVKLLCEYSATFHKRVTITIIETMHNEYVREKIRNICVPNDKVAINVQCT